MSQCFGFDLVPGSLRNVYEFKKSLRNLSVNSTSGTEKALRKAYETLFKARKTNRGALCNQAIILITDGATDDFQKLINELDPEKQVRIFTYLVGKEVTEIMPTRNMACNNRGQFFHIKDLADIREHVQNYVQVMSRPITLSRDTLNDQNRFYAYTSVYADITVSDVIL